MVVIGQLIAITCGSIRYAQSKKIFLKTLIALDDMYLTFPNSETMKSMCPLTNKQNYPVIMFLLQTIGQMLPKADRCHSDSTTQLH